MNLPKLVKEVNVLRLQPGDILALKVKPKIKPEVTEELRQLMIDVLRKAGHDNEVIVVSGGISFHRIKGNKHRTVTAHAREIINE